MTDPSKKYGLQIPIKKKSIFQQDDEDEEVDDRIGKVSSKSSSSGLVKGKATDHLAELMKHKNTNVEKTLKNALEEDPSAFDYDSFYDNRKDEMKASRLQLRGNQQQQSKQSVYIQGLMETAEQKKKNLEKVKEIQMRKERDQEADLYKDKESFITSAYKEKLEKDKIERQLEQEKEKKEQIQNSKTNLNSFHKNLFNNMYNSNSNSNSNNSNSSETEGGENKPSSKLIENQNKYAQLSDKYDKYDKYDKNDKNNYKNDRYVSSDSYDRYQQIQQPQQQTIQKKEKKNDNVFMPRRNDENSIGEAKERYLKRKSEKERLSQ